MTEPDYEANADALDEAIRRFNAENQQREGVVTGWVLMVSSNRYEDGDMHFAYDYSVGAGTDMMRAIGLVRVATMQMEHDILRPTRDFNDDE